MGLKPFLGKDFRPVHWLKALKAYVLASYTKQLNMQTHIRLIKRGLKPFHLVMAIYALIIIAGLLYRILN